MEERSITSIITSITTLRARLLPEWYDARSNYVANRRAENQSTIENFVVDKING